jgi:hypothetical protein
VLTPSAPRSPRAPRWMLVDESRQNDWGQDDVGWWGVRVECSAAPFEADEGTLNAKSAKDAKKQLSTGKSCVPALTPISVMSRFLTPWCVRSRRVSGANWDRNGDAASIGELGYLMIGCGHGETSESCAGRNGLPRPQPVGGGIVRAAGAPPGTAGIVSLSEGEE